MAPLTQQDSVNCQNLKNKAGRKTLEADVEQTISLDSKLILLRLTARAELFYH